MDESQMIDKMRVARQFSRAADKYDAAAHVQSDVAFDAQQRLPRTVGTLLDIGCGTGRVTQVLAQRANRTIGLDIAQGMLSYAAQRYPGICWLAGDAEALPLQSNSVDCVFSSMALQWCEEPGRVLQELQRVLRPGGKMVLAVMVENSLHELSHCWQQLDSAPHVNRFLPTRDWQYAAQKLGLSIEVQEQPYVTYHASVRELLGSIKDIGASVVNQTHNRAGLTKRTLQRFYQIYADTFANEQGFPLTYQIAFLTLEHS